MDIYISNSDNIALLRPPVYNKPQDSYKGVEYVKGRPYSSSKTSRVDTIHYLSPASTTGSTRTELEGDFYEQFQVFRDAFIAKKPIDYATSSSTKSSESTPCEEYQPQRTLAIIKPEAMQYQDVVLRTVKEKGFHIINKRLVHLSPEQVSEIYRKFYGSTTFPYLVVSLSSAPLLVLSLGRKDAVKTWQTMIGPYGLLREEWFYAYSVRTRFGIVPDIPEALHASENVEEAKWENRFFYPRSILEPLPADEQKVYDYITINLRSILLEGLTKICLTKPVDPVISLAEWLLLNNPFTPKCENAYALSPL